MLVVAFVVLGVLERREPAVFRRLRPLGLDFPPPKGRQGRNGRNGSIAATPPAPAAASIQRKVTARPNWATRTGPETAFTKGRLRVSRCTYLKVTGAHKEFGRFRRMGKST